MRLTALLSASALAGHALAQVGSVYCGSGPAPSSSDCEDAKNKIDDGSDYDTSTEITAGNCIIRVERGSISGQPSIGGSELKQVVGDIASACNYVGSELVSDGSENVNVTLLECQVCMYGTCGVCHAPSRKLAIREQAHKEYRQEATAKLFKEVEPAPRKRAESPIPVTANPKFGVFDKRDCSHPDNLPDVSCCPGTGAAVDQCNELADTVEGMGTLNLPFTTANEGCELAVEPKSSGVTVDSSLIATMVRAGTEGCDSTGYIGYTYDTGRENEGFDVYWGWLCGEFGFGYAGCTTGDPPGGEGK